MTSPLLFAVHTTDTRGPPLPSCPYSLPAQIVESGICLFVYLLFISLSNRLSIYILLLSSCMPTLLWPHNGLHCDVLSLWWPFCVTCFMQHLYLLICFVMKQFFEICFPEASRHRAQTCWQCRGSPVRPFFSLWLGISKTTWKDCGFVMGPPSGAASRWPTAFYRLSDVVEIKFLSKNAGHLIGLGLNYHTV